MSPIRVDLSATLDQLETVDERRRYFTDRQVAMLTQVMHRAGVRWRAGEMTREELDAFYSRVRAVGAVGFVKTWLASGLPDIRRIRAEMMADARAKPTEDDGSWAGTYPIMSQRRPAVGQAVVYLLYEGCEPVYLGSTENFLNRLAAHRRDGKRFTTWRAWPCRDREHAYRRETEMLKDSLPILNQRTGR